MGAEHGHNHGAGALAGGGRYRGRLALSFVLIFTFFVIEVVAGVATNSLALLSDAGHMFTDVLGLGMALAAVHLASRPNQSVQRTFGLYRLEVLAVLANAVLLFGVALYVLFEAVRRLGEPPEVVGIPMLIVASLGLVANLVVFVLLRDGSKESLNVEGAYLEVLSDMLGSVGVIGAAIVLQTTGWSYADPLVAVGIGLFILPRTWRLAAQAVRILVQAAPPGIDVEAVRSELAALEGVVDVHDVHLWTLTSSMEVASAHLMVSAEADTHAVLDQARDLLRGRFHVTHATIQVEPADHLGCAELSW